MLDISFQKFSLHRDFSFIITFLTNFKGIHFINLVFNYVKQKLRRIVFKCVFVRRNGAILCTHIYS